MTLPTPSAPAVTSRSARRPLRYGPGPVGLGLLLPARAPAQEGGGPPTMPLPSEAGGDSQALLAMAWGWLQFGLEIMVIGVGAAIFLLVAWFVVGKFVEIGRTQGTFAMAIPTVFVGMFTLAVAGVLLTIAWNVLQNTTLTA